MFAIIGIVVVFGCVVAGYLMEHGISGLDSAGRTGHHRRCGHSTATGSFRAAAPMPPAPDAR
jgi:hypothetical protein